MATRKIKASSGKTSSSRVQRAKVETASSITRSNQQSKSFWSNPRNRLIVLLVIMFLAAVYAARSLFVVALVNNEPIFRVEVIKQLEKQQGKNILSGLISRKLIEQEARKNNITVSKEEIDAQIKKIDEAMKKQGQSLDEQLKQSGDTKKDLEKEVRLQLSVEKLLAKEIAVSDKEIKDFKEKNAEYAAATDVDIRETVKQEKLRNAFAEWIQKVEKAAKVDYLVNY